MGVCRLSDVERAVGDGGVLRHLTDVHSKRVIERVWQRRVEALREARCVTRLNQRPRRLH